MNYKLLQIGDEIKNGDEWLSGQKHWRPVNVPVIQGCSVHLHELGSGTIYRRKVRRTKIKVKGGDCLDSINVRLDQNDIIHLGQSNSISGQDLIDFKAENAQALAAAILEVAGVEG